jgi:hypothetical protein
LAFNQALSDGRIISLLRGWGEKVKRVKGEKRNPIFNPVSPFLLFPLSPNSGCSHAKKD